jgi:hypothetical protein
MTAPTKTFILIVGIQRSGTSTVAQFLDHLGVYFGDPSHFIDPTKHTHNPIFYELQWIIDFNERVLATWDLRHADYVLPIESEFQRPEVTALRDSLKQQLLQEFGDRPLVGAKDPRLCFTFPLWREVLTEMGYAIKIIVTLRNPSAIMRSNRAMTPGRLSRWQRFFARHQLAARYFFRDFPVCYFDYDLLMQDPEAYAQKKAAELGLPIPDPALATRHISRQEYHHQPDDTGTGDPWVDRIDLNLRAGTLDPNEYLTFRSISLLLTEELRALWQNSPQNWYRQYQQIMTLLNAGGHFVAERQPNGRLDIRQIST